MEGSYIISTYISVDNLEWLSYGSNKSSLCNETMPLKWLHHFGREMIMTLIWGMFQYLLWPVMKDPPSRCLQCDSSHSHARWQVHSKMSHLRWGAGWRWCSRNYSSRHQLKRCSITPRMSWIDIGTYTILKLQNILWLVFIYFTDHIKPRKFYQFLQIYLIWAITATGQVTPNRGGQADAYHKHGRKWYDWYAAY